MSQRGILLAAALVASTFVALLASCGGGGKKSGGPVMPPVNPPRSDDYQDGYWDGYDDGRSNRGYYSHGYYDPWHSGGSYGSYYNDPYYNNYYSSTRSLSRHPYDCGCSSCNTNVNIYQPQSSYEVAGGMARPELRSGNLPLSGAAADGQLDGLELELLQMQRPLGVSELLWADLKQAAKEAARAASASGSGARDPGEGGRVTDLSVQPGSAPDTIRFAWTYRNDGDYDLDGRVRAADMALVGVWYGRSDSDPDWQRAKIADGNGDGRVSIADASLIGMNYGSQVDSVFVGLRLDDFNSDGQVNGEDFELFHRLHSADLFGPFSYNPGLWLDGLTAAEILGDPLERLDDRFYSIGGFALESVLNPDGSCSVEWPTRGSDVSGNPLQVNVSGVMAGIVSDYTGFSHTLLQPGFYVQAVETSPLSNVVILP